MRSRTSTLRRHATWTLPLLSWCLIGCGDVDWTWDSNWWRQPKRVVRPSRTGASSPARSKPIRPATVEHQPEKPPVQPDADPVTTAERQQRPLDSDAGPRRAVAATPKRGSHPFYQLYLVRGTESEGEDHRGEKALYLTEANPRRCAMLLEMLYIPVGRSGSSDECYLLYENFDEFKAATRFTPNLDVSSSKADGAPVGAEAAFAAGVAMFLDIAGQGAVVDRPSVEACERHLAQAVQSAQFSPLLRWAAGILAGRIASEYRYDYASAGSYYRQAERLAPHGSLERMTSQWWLANALTMEGKFEEANAARQSILAEYESHWQGSHITRRARAMVRQDGDR